MAMWEPNLVQEQNLYITANAQQRGPRPVPDPFMLGYPKQERGHLQLQPQHEGARTQIHMHPQQEQDNLQRHSREQEQMRQHLQRMQVERDQVLGPQGPESVREREKARATCKHTVSLSHTNTNPQHELQMQKARERQQVELKQMQVIKPKTKKYLHLTGTEIVRSRGVCAYSGPHTTAGSVGARAAG